MSGRSLNKFAWMEALRGADLTHAEYRVLVNLSTYARGDLTNAHPGLSRLCEDARVSEPTAKKALRRLVEKGWIVLTDRGGNEHWKGKANVYALSIPKGVTHLPPWGEKGVNPNTEGGNSFSEGGKSTPLEGGNSLTPHQKDLSGDFINGFQSGGVVALSNAGAREDALPPETVAEQAEAAFGELFGETPRSVDLDAYEPSVPVVDEPRIDPELTPLAWIDNELPGGFRGTERAEAQKRLEAGEHRVTIRWDLVKARHTRPKIGQRRHRFIEPNSQTSQEATP
ncbi:helix-turn-helix domain-containing protein [Rhodococcus sp. B50]|uniref:helix-turn-helix domain-containing protein n=1 Tax=Rhodococcus sp. B50 TaxID=2682847 RepID=UPI001BD66E29|nr:helix-turn-helix domain-containing protein [Rhodococcus sp. B50]MBS9371568.1 hypothetical protein [Rhodococcus sp. B50]